MKIAVTLASGKLGHAIINRLMSEEHKYQVVAYSRDVSKVSIEGVEVRKGDYDNPDDWNDSLKDIDIMILISSVVEPEKRVVQHRTIIDAAKKNDVKKILYTSIIGSEKDTAFAKVVRSNRETEEDIKNSGINYVIGRDGLYVDPDVDFIDEYKKAGCVWNCAGDGLCCYTSRFDLAVAYSKLALTDDNDGRILDLCGKSYSQQQLVDTLNNIFHLHLYYKYVSVEEFKENRTHDLGEFYGSIIAGLYESIAKGYLDVPTDYYIATGFEPLSLDEMIENIVSRANNNS